MRENRHKALRKQGIRAVSDLSNNKINYKIREHSLQKLPYQVVVGDKEMEARNALVSVRKPRQPGPGADRSGSACCAPQTEIEGRQ
jgi:threonyl-tRNA synthetase